MTDENELRSNRMTFYKKDMEAIAGIACDLVKQSKAKCVMLVDQEGHMVAQHGDAGDFDPETVSALVAGSFAATKEIARTLGEEEFSVLYHQGQKGSIQLSIVGERMLLAVVFDDATTLGLVRLCADQAVLKMLKIIEARKSGGARDEDLDEDFGSEATQQLDDLFDDKS